ncbi:MAG: hypothetical protein GY793_07880 [Proteobacteria bacterium]|nr:hypothetical protein [Pseudomonadota bacterium]
MRFTDKKGAMFALDARIALAIYSFVSMVILAYTINYFKQVDYNRFLSDVDIISKSVILYIRDTKAPVFSTVNQTDPLDTQELDTFANLQTSTKVIAPYNTRWNGPYLMTNYQEDPFLGVPFRLATLSDTYSTACNDTADNPCYIFLKLESVERSKCDAIYTFATNKDLTKIQRANLTSTDCDLLIQLTSDYN